MEWIYKAKKINGLDKMADLGSFKDPLLARVDAKAPVTIFLVNGVELREVMT